MKTSTYFLIALVAIIALVIYFKIRKRRKIKAFNEKVDAIKDIKNKIELSELSALLEKEDGSCEIIGEKKEIKLDEELNGKLIGCFGSYTSSNIVFEDRIITVFHSDLDMEVLKFDTICDISMETIFEESKKTQTQGSPLLRGSLASMATGGNMTVGALAALSTPTKETISSKYSHTKVTLHAKHPTKKRKTKKVDFYFMEPTDAIKFEQRVRELSPNLNA